MLELIAAAGSSKAFHVGLVLTTFGFGFRHGIDWDHIAALTDITSSQDDSRRSMLFATLYALGHALVVFVLGFAAIVFATELPEAADTIMERVVGATLIALGIYVFYALARHGSDFRMRSRWMLLFSGVRRGVRWARRRHPGSDAVEVTHDHSPEDHAHVDSGHPRVGPRGTALKVRHEPHPHPHVVAMPDDPFLNYGKTTAFGVGMIHGVGAETPTQVLIFLTAAGAGGRGAGVLLLVCFLAGLLSSNSLIAVAGTFGFLGASGNFRLYAAVSVLTATFSLVIGTVFLVGRSTLLPAIFGG